MPSHCPLGKKLGIESVRNLEIETYTGRLGYRFDVLERIRFWADSSTDKDFVADQGSHGTIRESIVEVLLLCFVIPLYTFFFKSLFPVDAFIFVPAPQNKEGSRILDFVS